MCVCVCIYVYIYEMNKEVEMYRGTKRKIECAIGLVIEKE